jgi:hypothetical protein
MTSSIATETPTCPDCSAPMRLTRLLPTALPKDCAPETRVFVRTSCGTTVTRTIHGGQSALRARRHFIEGLALNWKQCNATAWGGVWLESNRERAA